jgi:hypothetical protein
MAEEHAQYTITALLDTAVQPWPNMTDEDFDDLFNSIKDRGLTDPIDLSRDGIVFDGSQRLRVLLKQKRKFINAKDVRIWEDVDSENIMGWAVRRNSLRRPITLEMKIEAAWRMRQERKMPQREIAKVFGVTQGRVSQWFSSFKEEAADEKKLADFGEPLMITGKDGKEYPAEASGRGRPKKEAKLVSMWAPAGPASRAVKKALGYLERGVEGHEPVAGLDGYQLDTLLNLLNDTQESAAALAEIVANLRENPGVESGSLDLDR